MLTRPPTAPGRSPLDDARDALAAAQDEPASSAATASELLDRHDDPEVRHLALWARGRARHEQGRFSEALGDLHESAAAAATAGDQAAWARVTANRALTEYALGDVAAALASLHEAEPVLRGADAGQLHLQRAIVLVHDGALGRARRSFDIAHALLRDAGDDAAVARCLASRGVAATYLGDFDAAAADLEAAAEAAAATGQRLVAAGAIHNLGYVRARQGDVPGALERFGQAADAYRSLGSPARVVASLDQDRAEVLLEAGLVPEAVAAARRAVIQHDAAGADTATTDARLLLAEAELAAGNAREARDTAAVAAARFSADGRTAWAARARYVGLRSELLDIDHQARPERPELLAEASALAELLASAGWAAESIHARTLAGRIGLATGNLDAVRAVLTPATAVRRSGPVALRVQGWHATALLRLAAGDRSGARRAARQGLRVVDEHRDALGGVELRAGAARHGADLARLGLRMALQDRRAGQVLAWTEHARARALAATLDPIPADEEQRRLLAALRAAHAHARAEPGAAEGRRTIADLERRLRERDLGRRSASTSTTPRPLDAPGVRANLDDEVFVSIVELDGTLWSVVSDARRTALHELGGATDVAYAVQQLRFACERLAHASTGRGIAAAFDSFQAARTLLDGRLGLAGLPDGPLVVSPSASTHGLPWAALPSLVGRPVTVTPSATVWASPSLDRGHGHGVCAVAGPDLPAATAEADDIGRLHPGARVLVGAEATVAATVEAFGTNELLHIAAHGSFRSDNPSFSGMQLADGPLTLLDLRSARSAPSTMVLPACHVAGTRLLEGDEPLGAVAGLVALGVRTVIAPLGAVPDAATAAIMADLHRRIAAGAEPTTAAAGATGAALASQDPRATAAGATLVVSGRRHRGPGPRITAPIGASGSRADQREPGSRVRHRARPSDDRAPGARRRG